MDVELIFKVAAVGVQKISELFDMIKQLFNL